MFVKAGGKNEMCKCVYCMRSTWQREAYHLGVRARWRCCCGRAAAMVMAMVAQLYIKFTLF